MNNILKNLNKLHLEKFDEAMYNINMSARKIKKSYISCTGYFASYKNKTQIAFESVLERDLYMLLEFDKDVVSYEEQPITINYEYKDGSKRKYTPDCLVKYKNGKERYVEVKYVNEINDNQELEEKLDFLKSYFYDEYFLKFEVFTDKDIGQQYLENLKFLYKFAFIQSNEQKILEINRILNEVDYINIKEILQMLSEDKYKQLEWLPYVWHYVFINNNVTNLRKRLTMNTKLEKKVML